MPKLKPDIQRARREHILDAAEQCFARAGFHRTTMHDICKEAGVSPGALYVYFDSKEALIAGISERDRAEFAERLDRLAAAPDFMQALRELGEQYFLEDPATDHRMCIEIGLESTRNPRIGEIFQRFDRYIARKLRDAVPEDEGRGPHRARRSTSRPWRGRSWWSATACSGAAPSIPASTPRRSCRPCCELIRTLLNPVPGRPTCPTDNNNQARQ